MVVLGIVLTFAPRGLQAQDEGSSPIAPPVAPAQSTSPAPRQEELSPVRRSDVMVGIDYDADVNQAQQVISAAVQGVKGVESSPPPLVLVDQLAESTVKLKVRFWVNSRQQSFLQVTSDVAQAIKEQLQAAHIEMPSEIYTLTFRDSPLAFVTDSSNALDASDGPGSSDAPDSELSTHRASPSSRDSRQR